MFTLLSRKSIFHHVIEAMPGFLSSALLISHFNTIKLEYRIREIENRNKLNRHRSTSVCKIKTGKISP